VRPEGRDENHAAAVAKYGKQLLHQEIRRADVDCEELIEILDRGFLDGRRFRDPCIGDKDVQAISDDAPELAAPFEKKEAPPWLKRYKEDGKPERIVVLEGEYGVGFRSRDASADEIERGVYAKDYGEYKTKVA
jgi:hypothetical protein